MTETRAQALDVAWIGLQIDPEAVKAARDFATTALGALAKTDADHVDAVRTVVSELVTNAIKYGAGADRTNIGLEVGIWSLWTLVTVDDRDPRVRRSRVRKGDDLPESGRGLLIVRALAARFWWDPRLISKTATAAILRTGVTLTDGDQAVLDELERTGE